jgi:hypothetical protein
VTRLRHLLLVVLFALLAAPALACPGDCDGDGTVRINELIAGVGIALGQSPVDGCPPIDGDGDGQVLIGELIAATNALLSGCPAVTATPTATPTTTPSPSPPPTATVNLPPVLAPFVYRGFVGQPIARPIGASDPNGDPLTCAADALLAGMTLGDDQVLRWTPAAEQLGPLAVPVSCEDSADPPQATAGALEFRIAPVDACTTPVCDPATGCTATLPPLDQNCCADAEPTRLPEAPVICPSGLLLQVGRNDQSVPLTFGRLYNCDYLRFRQRAQSDAELRIHVRVSCVNTLNRVTIGVRLESAVRGVIVNAEGGVFLPTMPTDGFYERRNFSVPFNISGPFLDLEETEATLTVTAEDSGGAIASETLRVILTSDSTLPDLPDL